ncbi:UNVERIFIED_CONTAM: hypothetical protein FKN15_024851 [Acipenser sinensis]
MMEVRVNLTEEGDIEFAAGVLKLFLRELPKSVIPDPLHVCFMGAFKGNKDKAELNQHLKKLLGDLPQGSCTEMSNVNKDMSATEENTETPNAPASYPCAQLVKQRTPVPTPRTRVPVSSLGTADPGSPTSWEIHVAEMPENSMAMSPLIMSTTGFTKSSPEEVFGEEGQLRLKETTPQAEKKALEDLEKIIEDSFKPKRSKSSSETSTEHDQDQDYSKLVEDDPTGSTQLQPIADNTTPAATEESNASSKGTIQDDLVEDDPTGSTQLQPIAGNTTPAATEESNASSKGTIQDDSSLLKLQALEVDLCSSFLPAQEDGAQLQHPKEHSLQAGHAAQGEDANTRGHYILLTIWICPFSLQPSHNDKTANPEIFKLMNDLAKSRKQLKDLKLKMSVKELREQGSQQRELCRVNSGQQGAVELQQKPCLEETVESLIMRLREKRTALGLPENMKEMTQKQMALEKVTLQKCLLYFESLHGRPGTKQERNLMKPLYDRYRMIKQFLCATSSITTIEEEGSDEENMQHNPLPPSRIISQNSSDESLCPYEEDNEPTSVSPLDEMKAVRQTVTMSNLHEASVPELLEHLRETRAEKKRLRKALRDYEDQFLRQMGRTAQKEDRIPMAEEYCEFKLIKAKLKLLEVLVSKRGAAQTT